MNNSLTITIIAILCITGYGYNFTNAQNNGYSKTYFFEERSTIFHAVKQLNDKLIVIGEIGVDSFGNNGIFIASLDTFGAVNQLKIYQDPDNIESLDLNYTISPWEALVITEDSKIVLACTFRKGLDLVLIELDSNLNHSFYKHYPTNFTYSKFIGSIVLFESEYYIIGSYQTNQGDFDIFITKTDLNGNLIWEKTYGTPNNHDYTTSGIVEHGGITILASQFRDPDPLIPNNDIVYNKLIHIDTSGDVKWTKVSDLNEEGISAISLIKNNEKYYYITHPTYEDQENIIHYKPQIVCRDEFFELEWRENYGEYYYKNQLTSLAFGPDSFLYSAGYIPDDFTWGRVCKIDPQNGQLVWEARDTAIVIPGWGSRNRMESLTVLPSRSVIAAGYTVNSTFHENGLLYKVTKDGCIDTLCTSVGLQDLIDNKEHHKVHIYPNPATSQIFIDTSIPIQSSTLKLFDINGILVEQILLPEEKNSLSLQKSKYENGLYFWTLVSKSGQLLDIGKIYIQTNK